MRTDRLIFIPPDSRIGVIAVLDRPRRVPRVMTPARRVLSMRAIETVHAEPRDSIDSPTYRVNFWQRSSPERAWNLDAYALTGVEDITEVLQWVDEHGAGRRFEVFVEMDEEPARSFQSPRKAGLVRLLGSNPNAGETVEIVRFVKM
jgi:hypothetical protein